ncbi:MAG: hypothetical protein D6696_00455 [Acidobacteria bacterium]|nr:MAG: hypothetical protein D6696_00455 [Acidobacteriota bacterium]
MNRCPELQQPPLARLPFCWRLALAIVPLVASPARGELAVELIAGIEQQRDFERAGVWTRQWVRSLPPSGQPYLMVVQGPRAWLAEPGLDLPPAEVAARDRPHRQVLRRAMSSAGLLAGGEPPAVAGRVLALLRPLVLTAGAPPARHARLWRTWEILADAPHADALSVAFSAQQLLLDLGIEAAIAAFPTRTGGLTYGLWLAGEAAAVEGEDRDQEPWAYRVGSSWLLPASPSPSPRQPLGRADLELWPPAAVLAAPSLEALVAGATPPPETSQGTAGPRLAAPPDLCRQARALGLPCRPPGIRRRPGTAGSVLLALLLVALLGWGTSAWRRRAARLRRVREARHRGERDAF